MANSGKVISTTVKLDGVEAVKKSLEALGKAGASAFKSIRDAADKISPGLGGKLDAAVAKLKAGFKDIQTYGKNVANQFGKLRVATTRLGGEFLGVAKRIGIIGGAIIGAGAAFIAFTKNAADNADAVGKNADALGLSIKSFQSLEFAAAQSSISSEEFGKGFARLSKLIGDGLSGNKAAIQKLKDLGIAYKDATGKLVVPKTNQEALLRLSDTLAGIKDPARRAAVASELFGKSFAKWLPFLTEGRDAIKGVQDQFNKSGLGFTGEEAKKADAFGDSMDFLFKTLGQLRDKAFLKFAEPLTKAFGEATSYIIAHSDEILKNIQNLADSVGPIIEDIVNALAGNDKDVKNQWVLDLRDGIKEIGTVAKDTFDNIVKPAFKSLSETADTVANTINSIFGTNLSGKGILLGIAVASLTGVLGPLAAAIGLVTTAFGLLAVLLTPVGLGIAAVAAVAALIYVFWDDIVAYAGQAWDLIKGYAADAWDWIKGTAAQGADYIGGLWGRIKDLASQAWGAIKGYAADAWDGIKSRVSDGIDGVNALWRGATDYFKSLWSLATDYVNVGIESVKSAISGVISRVKDAIASIKAMFSAENNQGAKADYLKKAGGGYISGPGTSTSDSIPARLSKGEFVIRAAAVRRYGAQLFAALNGMRISPNSLGRFAVGGLVGFPSVPMTAIPAGAGGPTSTLNLVLDGQTYGGLSGSADTIKSLERAIKARRIRSTGRPSPYER